MIQLLVTLAIGYAFVVFAVGVFQRRLLYVPTRLDAKVVEQTAGQLGFSPWRNPSGELIGWRLPTLRPVDGSVLIIHGNAGSAIDRDYLAVRIQQALSLEVFVLEYPGYGARSGSPNLTSLLAAGKEALHLLPADKPVYLVSESLGAGVAAHLAKIHPERIGGLAMFVPYEDLAPVAQHAMPLVPSRFLLRDRFRPSLWLRDYGGPIKVVLAEADQIIPMKFGQRLYDLYAGPKSLQVVSNAHHNEVEDQSADWWREVYSFWQANPRPAQ